MDNKFSSPPPKMQTLEDAQEFIDRLWLELGEILRSVQEKAEKIQDQAQRIRDLEERIGLNSKNSSKSPSTDNPNQKSAPKAKAAFPRKPGKKRGGQPGHKGKARELLPIAQVDHVVICPPSTDCGCGGRVWPDRDQPERHQVFELPKIRPDVTEYQIFSGICTTCGKRHVGHLPNGVPDGMLGPCAMAKIAIMTGEYRMSRRLVERMLNDFHGLTICLGSISKTEQNVSDAIAPPVMEAVSYVQGQKIPVNGDETGHKQAGKKMWLWVASTLFVTVFIIRAKRGAREAMDLLGENFLGILMSDRWSAYTWVDVARRQLCWAHLIRDFIRIALRGGTEGRIGLKLLAYTRRMFNLWHRVRAGTLSRAEFQHDMVAIRAKIEALLEQGTQLTDKKNQKTCNTCKKILKLRVALWTFVEHEGVEPTNNQAERMLRHYVLWRKGSFGTQSERGNLFVERMMTVVSTCRQQKRSVLDYVTAAVKAHLHGQPSPSLLPQNSESIDRAA